MILKDPELFRKITEAEEGCKLNIHDVDGVPHLGIGHNMAIPQSEEEQAILDEAGYDPSNPESLLLTQEQAYALFDVDINDAIEDLDGLFDEAIWDSLNEARQCVVLSMLYQMGRGTVRKFKMWKQAIIDCDWNTAADNMIYADPTTERHSHWYLQTPARCERTANAMRDGFWEDYQDDPRGPHADPVGAQGAFGTFDIQNPLEDFGDTEFQNDVETAIQVFLLALAKALDAQIGRNQS